MSHGTPIENGVNAGTIRRVGNSIEASRQKVYPYAVFVETIETIDGKRILRGCAGVIIGIKSVLTAGHCLHGKVNPIVFVYAGIIDLKWEVEKAQKIAVKEYHVHQHYQSKCRVGTNSCYEVNDIAIMWLQRNFEFGPFVRPAKLNGYIKKPVGRKGWILGWGLKANNVQTSMLQKGLVQVIPQEECEGQNPGIHITENVMCVRGFKKTTRANLGDSGGPLVLGEMVFGISSISLLKGTHTKDRADVYTDVARYSGWIRDELKLEKRECRSESCTII